MAFCSSGSRHCFHEGIHSPSFNLIKRLNRIQSTTGNMSGLIVYPIVLLRLEIPGLYYIIGYIAVFWGTPWFYSVCKEDGWMDGWKGFMSCIFALVKA